MKYDYGYKHLQILINNLKIIVELSEDTMLNRKTYCAKSDLMFKDEYGDWGHAVGVGRNEQDALNMCIDEIDNYTSRHIDMGLITEINLPKRIVFEYKKKTIVLYFEQLDNCFSVLTKNGRKNIITDNIIEYIANNPKEFINDNVDNYSEQLFKMHNFSKPFDAMTKKYDSSATYNINSH